jgi:hypothetical protein
MPGWPEAQRFDTARVIVDRVRQEMMRREEDEGSYFDGSETVHGSRPKDQVFHNQLTETLSNIRRTDEWQSFQKMLNFMQELRQGEELWNKEKSYIMRVKDWMYRYPAPVVSSVKNNDFVGYATIVGQGTGLYKKQRTWINAIRGDRSAVQNVCSLYGQPNLLGKPGEVVHFGVWGASLVVNRSFPPIPDYLDIYPPNPNTAAIYTALVLTHRAKMQPTSAPTPPPSAAPTPPPSTAPTPPPSAAPTPPPSTAPTPPPSAAPTPPPSAATSAVSTTPVVADASGQTTDFDFATWGGDPRSADEWMSAYIKTVQETAAAANDPYAAYAAGKNVLQKVIKSVENVPLGTPASGDLLAILQTGEKTLSTEMEQVGGQVFDNDFATWNGKPVNAQTYVKNFIAQVESNSASVGAIEAYTVGIETLEVMIHEINDDQRAALIKTPAAKGLLTALKRGEDLLKERLAKVKKIPPPPPSTPPPPIAPPYDRLMRGEEDMYPPPPPSTPPPPIAPPGIRVLREEKEDSYFPLPKGPSSSSPPRARPPRDPLSKYRDMREKRVPFDVIIQQMQRSGVSDELINVFTEEYTSSKPPPPPKPESESALEKEGEDDESARFDPSPKPVSGENDESANVEPSPKPESKEEQLRKGLADLRDLLSDSEEYEDDTGDNLIENDTSIIEVAKKRIELPRDKNKWGVEQFELAIEYAKKDLKILESQLDPKLLPLLANVHTSRAEKARLRPSKNLINKIKTARLQVSNYEESVKRKFGTRKGGLFNMFESTTSDTDDKNDDSDSTEWEARFTISGSLWDVANFDDGISLRA